MNQRRISIIGTGNVGTTYAYALLLSGLVSEIILIDANHAKAEGEAMDLNHAVPFTHPTRVWAGDYSDCAGSAITVLSAGAGQKPGETRLDLVKKNAAIWRQIIPEVVKHNPTGLLLIATNPVDILTRYAWKLSGLPSRRVIGSGTILDTARFRYLLSQHFKVDARSVHAYIIGEHGDSEVPVWSLANIAGMRLGEFSRAQGISCDQTTMDSIFTQTRDAAYHIIERKGATFYAVAAGLMSITQAILRDQRSVLSISSLVEDYYDIRDVCLSLPTVVASAGVESVLRLELSQEEVTKLKQSAEVLRTTFNLLEGSTDSA
jgi:L-lactate dehydrogenase